MPATITEFAAWFGAVTGTLALAWDFFKWKRSGPRVRVRAESESRRFLVNGVAHETKLVNLTVVNHGDRPTTITRVVGAHYRSPWLRCRIQLTDLNLLLEPVDDEAAWLPHVLSPGEQWTAQLNQVGLEGVLDLTFELRVDVLFGVEVSTSSRPAFSRVKLQPLDRVLAKPATTPN